MFTLNEKRINIYAPHETQDGTRYGNLTDPAVRAAVGVVEIPDPQPPEDYSDETYYRTEQDDAPYVVFTRKSDEQLAALKQSKLDAKLNAVRAVREGILNRLAGIALSAQLSGDAATMNAYLTVRQGLLDITKEITDPDDVEATVTARYSYLLAQCTMKMITAFAEVDA